MEDEKKEVKKTRVAKQGSLTLVQKMLEVKKSVDYLQKSTQGSQFNYTSSSQVLSAVRNAMNEQGLMLIPAIISSKLTSTPNRNDVLSHMTELWMTMTWVDTVSGETLVIPWYGQGVDLAGEKGVGKNLTYSEKYHILKVFSIPTDKDDPDSHQQANLPQADVKAMLIEKLAKAANMTDLGAVWSDNVKYQGDKEFIAACTAAKVRLTPNTDA